jgi:HSP20 family protein
MVFPRLRTGRRRVWEIPDPATLRAGSSNARFADGRQLRPKEAAMRALMPWTGMKTFPKDIDRLFDRFFDPKWPAMPALGEWEPTLDVSETKDAVMVKAELPGVDQKDIAVSLVEGTLTIKGEKHAEKEEKDERYHRIERSYGAFYRTVPLPATVDTEKVTATFKDGVVTITLPKAAVAKGTTIPVKAA